MDNGRKPTVNRDGLRTPLRTSGLSAFESRVHEVQNPPGMTSRTRLLGLVASVLLVVCLRLPYVNAPLDIDEGTYAATVMKAASGYSLYADLNTNRPPLLYAYYSASRALDHALGLSPAVSIRLLALLACAFTVAVVFWSLGQLFGLKTALVGGVVTALLASMPLTQAVGGNAEVFMLPFYAASGVLVLLSVRRAGRRGIVYAVLAGAACALAALTKQVGAIAALLPLAALPLAPSKDNRRLVLLGGFSGGLVVVALAALAWTLLTGQFREFLVFGGFSNLYYVQMPMRATAIANLLYSLRLLRLEFTLPALCVVLALIWGILQRDKSVWLMVFALAWLGLSFLGVAASGRYYPHYYVQMVPSLAVGAAIASSRGWHEGRFDATERRTALAGLAILLLAIGATVGVSNSAAYNNRYIGGRETGLQLKAVTSSADTVFVWGARSDILAYADRVSSTRATWTYYALAPYGERASQVVMGIALENSGDIILDDLANEPPAAIVLARPLQGGGTALDDPDDPRVAEELERMIVESYVLADVSEYPPDGVELYVRKSQ
ncbi:MAG: hypothetical protein Q8K99_05235 [Actinomycetota bacterium]|nr:hypothetical protein [Actinomycetota bacterium]